jgi:hypothetical protein
MKISRRSLCWLSCFAAVMAFGAAPPTQFPDVSSIEMTDVLLSLGRPSSTAAADPLRVLSVIQPYIGTFCFDDMICVAEYEGFGGVIIVHYERMASGAMALRSFEVGVDGRGRVPLQGVLSRLRPNMAMREVEQALAEQSSGEAVCGSAGAWQRRSYVQELRRGLVDPIGRVIVDPDGRIVNVAGARAAR